MNPYLRQAGGAAKEAALISAVDLGVSAVLYLVLSIQLLDSFGFLVLIESAVLMLVGGALSFAGQPGVRTVVGLFNRGSPGKKSTITKDELERNDLRAALYAIAGLLLFLEGVVLTTLLS